MLTVHRKSYTRKDGTRVKATKYRTKNMGKRGHGKKLFTLRKGGLSEYGYHVMLPEGVRRVALERAIRDGIPIGTLIKRVGALAVLQKRTKYGSAYKGNRNWLSLKLRSSRY